MFKKGLIASTSILAISIVSGGQPVWAADSSVVGAAAAPAQQAGEIENIVVTAQKRSQNVNDVAMSITAVTGDSLLARAITKPTELVMIEPSLQVAQASWGTTIYSIRGVGYYDASLAAPPAVSLYQDEVPLTYPAFSKSLMLDLDHVEILKGPQGTLFGQNSTGGAINFIPAAPTDTFKTGATLMYGKFNATDLRGYISGPISETLSARLAVGVVQGGAWQKSLSRDDKLGDQETYMGRLLIDWRPTDSFKASLNVNGWADNSQPQAGQMVGIWFQGPNYISPVSPADLGNPLSRLPNPAYFATYPGPIQQQVSVPTNVHNDRAADWDATLDPKNHERFYQVALRMEYKPSAEIGFTSLTSYEHYTQSDRRDTGGAPVALEGGTFGGHVTSFYQELRAQGVLDNGRLSWLVGGNYGEDRTSEVDEFNFNYTSNAYLTGGSIYSPFNTTPFTEFGQTGTVNSKTLAVFGNVDYDILPEVKLHAGIRYNKSDIDFSGCSRTDNFLLSMVFNGGTPPGQCLVLLPDGTHGTYRTSLNQHNIPWHVGVDWKPVDNALLYLSVSQGFKAGSSPTLAAISYKGLIPVTQEKLLSYEAGFKTQWLGNTLQLNGAAFYYDYRDKQLLGRIVDPIFGNFAALVNIPKSRVIGEELSVLWRATQNLTLNAAVTHLDSKVTSSFPNFAPQALNNADTVDFQGESFPFTPKWSLNYGLHYEQPISNSLSGFVGANGTYQSGTVGAFGASHLATLSAPSFDIKGYAILDLSAGVESADGHWRFELWGKNVTNTYYWSSVFTVNDSTARMTGMPATYGITLSVRN